MADFRTPDDAFVFQQGQSQLPLIHPDLPPVTVEEADGMWSSLKAGWQESTTGLITRMENPDMVLARDSDMAERLAYMIARTAGDFPTMVLGAAGGATVGGGEGAAVGSIVPGPGTAVGAVSGAVIGGAVGAGVLTEGTRRWLMERYRQPDADFFTIVQQLAVSLGAAGKGGLIYGSAPLGGGAAGSLKAVQAMGPMAKTVAVTAGEVAAMTTMARGLEGELPKPEDFMDAAVLLGGMKMAIPAAKLTGRASEKLGTATRNLMEHYEKTAQKPREAAIEALVDANLRAKFLSERDAQIARDLIGQKIKRQETVRDHLSELYTSLVDDLNPINKFVREVTGKDGESLPADMNPYKLARLARGVQGKAAARLHRLTEEVDAIGGVKGKGATERQLFRDSLKEYLIAARAVELRLRDKKSGIDDAGIIAMKRLKDNAPKKVTDAAQRIYDFQNNLVMEAVENGLLTKKQAKGMIELNKHYIPFRRLFENEEGVQSRGSRKRFHKIKGSNKKIVDPYESIVNNTVSLLRAMEENDVSRLVVEMGGKKFQKVKPQLREARLTDAEWRKIADELGLEADDALSLGPDLSIFRQGRAPLAPDMIQVWEKGKLAQYRVGKELAQAVRALDPHISAPWLKVFAAPANLLRAFTVVDPAFWMRNFMRDQVTASVYSQAKYKPFTDFMGGLMSYLKQDAIYDAWREAGGENTALLSADRVISGSFNVKHPNPWNTINVPKKAYLALRDMSEAVENATRIGEFKRSIDAGASAKEAAYRSREVTLDFARKGQTYARAANQLIAFWNVHIQGIDRFARAVKQNPEAAITRSLLTITAPTITLWMWNHDKDWYKEVPQWQKDLFWLVSPDDGETVYRIPKPFEVGLLFGTTFEHMLDGMLDHDEKAFSTLREAYWTQMMTDFLPTAAVPILETLNNRTAYTGAPVVRADIEDLLTEVQYTEYTSPVAKGLAKMMGYIPGIQLTAMGGSKGAERSLESPAVVEHFLGSWGGSLGRSLIDAFDLAFGEVTDTGPDFVLADIPFVKSFVVRHPSGGSESVARFLDDFQEFKTVRRSLDALIRRGDIATATHILREHGDRLAKIDSINDRISEMRKMVRQIWQAPPGIMKREEKRQFIDQLYYAMIQVAKAGNEQIKEINKLRDEGYFKAIMEGEAQ